MEVWEAASALGVWPDTIRRWIRAGQLRAEQRRIHRGRGMRLVTFVSEEDVAAIMRGEKPLRATTARDG